MESNLYFELETNKWDNHKISHMKFNIQYQSKEWYI